MTSNPITQQSSVSIHLFLVRV